MRPFLAVACFALLCLCSWLAAQGQSEEIKVRLRLVDADSGKSVPGIIRLTPRGADQATKLPGLQDRMVGFKIPDEFTGWHVLPAEGAEVSVPPGKYRWEGLSGLETDLAVKDLDLDKKAPEEIRLPLSLLFRPEERNLVPGNTHLHLMKVTKEQAETYLRQVPAADRLKVLFISYLERKPDDKEYVTNHYPIGDLPQFKATGVLVNNGQEHRHNFQAYGEGYGHVMFLNIKQLVQPVSVGPGIMLAGTDDPALRPGIDNARAQQGTVIWCHNTNGFEDVLSALSGRLDAMNVFDGSRGGTFEDNYYRYLNIGLRLPITTGTDWFMYDFSRVYAEVKDKLIIPAWLDAVKAGKCQATNGPLLSLTVNGKGLGSVLDLKEPGTVRVEASALGRVNFGLLELVHNGKVIHTEKVEAKKGPYFRDMTYQVKIDGPGWLAARVTAREKNELGQVVFAHTAPIYVDVAGKRPFVLDDALAMLKQIEAGAETITAKGVFGSPQAKAQVLGLYEEGAKELRGRINRVGK